MGKLKDTKWMDIVLIENERYSVSALRKGEDKIGVFSLANRLVFFDKDTEVRMVKKFGEHSNKEA